jgi:hemicentin
LYIQNIKKSDEGTYSCLAKNNGGIVTKKYYVKVIEKPRLLNSEPETSNVGVELLHSIILECKVQVDPQVETEYVWLKSGQYLSELYLKDKDTKFTLLDKGRKLQLLSARENDTGIFSCIAKNKGGEVKKEYNLLVKSKLYTYSFNITF